MLELPILVIFYVLYCAALCVIALYGAKLFWMVFKYIMKKVGELWLWAYNIMEEERIKRCTKIATL